MIFMISCWFSFALNFASGSWASSMLSAFSVSQYLVKTSRLAIEMYWNALKMQLIGLPFWKPLNWVIINFEKYWIWSQDLILKYFNLYSRALMIWVGPGDGHHVIHLMMVCLAINNAPDAASPSIILSIKAVVTENIETLTLCLASKCFALVMN